MMRRMKNKRVLITGGFGFIGTNLIRKMLPEGYEVRVIDDLSTGNRDFLEGMQYKFFQGDIRDREILEEALDGVDLVVHLAGHTNVIESIENPMHDLEINVLGTLNLLQVSLKRGIKRFVLASSNAPLGDQEPPVDESQVPHPLSPYGASKLACEGYCAAFHGGYGLETVVLRFANVYGSYSTHKTSVVAKFIRHALRGEPIVIYGDGKQTRDFVHVEDLCHAIILSTQKRVGGELFNIASGIETSVLELVDTIREASGKDFEVKFEPARRGEILRNYASIEKARDLLGYDPQVRLPEGVKECYEWFRRNYTYN